MLLGESLGAELGARVAFWRPASVISGFSYYAETVRQYDAGAAFPCLVSIGFDTLTDNNSKSHFWDLEIACARLWTATK